MWSTLKSIAMNLSQPQIFGVQYLSLVKKIFKTVFIIGTALGAMIKCTA